MNNSNAFIGLVYPSQPIIIPQTCALGLVELEQLKEQNSQFFILSFHLYQEIIIVALNICLVMPKAQKNSL